VKVNEVKQLLISDMIIKK